MDGWMISAILAKRGDLRQRERAEGKESSVHRVPRIGVERLSIGLRRLEEA